MILMDQCYSGSGIVVHLLITEVRGKPRLCIAFSVAEEHCHCYTKDEIQCLLSKSHDYHFPNTYNTCHKWISTISHTSDLLYNFVYTFKP